MSNIKVVASRTIVKKITVGRPVPYIKQVVKYVTSDEIADFDVADRVNGDTLVYDAATKKWVATTIDGGEGF